MKKNRCCINGCIKTGKIVFGLCRKHYYLFKKYGYIPNKKIKRTRKIMRLELIEMLGGKCVRCGIEDIRILQIGHKNGNGNSDRKKHTSDFAWYKFYLENPLLVIKELELMCANDNMIVKFERQEWCNQYTKSTRYPIIN